MASVLFVLPLLALYEAGLQLLAPRGATRTGADAWLHLNLSRLAELPPWAPSALLVLLILAWQLVERREWWCPASHALAMLGESVVLGIGLVGLSRLVDLGFARLDGHALLSGGPTADPLGPWAPLALGFVGAGIFEEALFRLALVPLLFGSLRLLQTPSVLATTLAVTASSLLFAVAHDVGDPADGFQWYVFVFRWAAGVYFAWVFILRGFGIAVGAHIAYDILVGCVGLTW
jgi:hypothetical protein